MIEAYLKEGWVGSISPTDRRSILQRLDGYTVLMVDGWILKGEEKCGYCLFTS